LVKLSFYVLDVLMSPELNIGQMFMTGNWHYYHQIFALSPHLQLGEKY